MRQYRGTTKEGKVVKGWYLEMPGKQKSQIRDEGNGAVSCKLDDAETIPCIAYKGKSPTALDFSKVIPESVGQDTGLKDKKGTPIFGSLEGTKGGDIVNDGKGKMEVFWSPLTTGRWWFCDLRTAKYVKDIDLSLLEVIGTAYEEKVR